MKKIVFIPKIDKDEKEDLGRIIRVAKANGYDLSLVDAYHLWEAYSSSNFSGWCSLPSDKEIIEILLDFGELK